MHMGKQVSNSAKRTTQMIDNAMCVVCHLGSTVHLERPMLPALYVLKDSSAQAELLLQCHALLPLVFTVLLAVPLVPVSLALLLHGPALVVLVNLSILDP